MRWGRRFTAMVTGRPPFQAATAMDTVLQVMSDEPVPPRRLNASIPRDLETICLKCLEKEPAQRYAVCGGAGGGPAPVPGGRADPGPAGDAVRARGQVGAAAAGDRRAAGIGRAGDGAGAWGRALAMARGGAGPRRRPWAGRTSQGPDHAGRAGKRASEGPDRASRTTSVRRPR